MWCSSAPRRGGLARHPTTTTAAMTVSPAARLINARTGRNANARRGPGAAMPAMVRASATRRRRCRGTERGRTRRRRWRQAGTRDSTRRQRRADGGVAGAGGRRCVPGPPPPRRLARRWRQDRNGGDRCNGEAIRTSWQFPPKGTQIRGPLRALREHGRLLALCGCAPSSTQRGAAANIRARRAARPHPRRGCGSRRRRSPPLPSASSAPPGPDARGSIRRDSDSSPRRPRRACPGAAAR